MKAHAPDPWEARQSPTNWLRPNTRHPHPQAVCHIRPVEHKSHQQTARQEVQGAARGLDVVGGQRCQLQKTRLTATAPWGAETPTHTHTWANERVSLRFHASQFNQRLLEMFTETRCKKRENKNKRRVDCVGHIGEGQDKEGYGQASAHKNKSQIQEPEQEHLQKSEQQQELQKHDQTHQSRRRRGKSRTRTTVSTRSAHE